MAFQLRSSSFHENGTIPKRNTCDGADVSVPLSWTDPPEGVKSFALIVDDPDAPRGTWVHWVLYDLPAETEHLVEDMPRSEILNDGAKQGVNDFGRVGYGGPCPPPGSAHRYFFTLYALDRMTGLKPRATKQAVLHAIKGHTLGQAQWVGVYKR
jgi:hypothetical protein